MDTTDSVIVGKETAFDGVTGAANLVALLDEQGFLAAIAQPELFPVAFAFVDAGHGLTSFVYAISDIAVITTPATTILVLWVIV